MCYRKQYDRDNSLSDNLPEFTEQADVIPNGLFDGAALVRRAKVARAWALIDRLTPLFLAVAAVLAGFGFMAWLTS